MQREVQKVIWLLHSDKDRVLEIDKDGNKIIFSKETIQDSYRYNFFSLYDIYNDLMYSIDLSNGDFIINGVSMEPCKEISGRMMSFSNRGTDYRSGLIQYKESMPIRVGTDDPIIPKNFNIGWKQDFSEKNIFYNSGDSFSSQIMNVKCILSIDSETLKPRFSISVTELRKFKDGKEEMIKS